jgi:hypothetical protein
MEIQSNNRDVKFEGIQYNNLMMMIIMKSGRSLGFDLENRHNKSDIYCFVGNRQISN